MENGPRPEVEVIWRSTEAEEEYSRRDKSGGIFKQVQLKFLLFQHILEGSLGCSDHRTGKGQFSFQFQRKAMPKHIQTTAQLHSSHTLAK